MKYSTIIRENSSHAKILKEIPEGVMVLECGCADGYMTRYMSEKLNAQVYIIEREKKAFDIAINFAKDGICADLLGDEWREFYRGYKFDYILFADVLEHLYDPVYVLQSAAAILKEDGKIIVSLPNIGNNDIIMSLYEDNWNYKPLGLLDDTHIRFFGRKNLDGFFAKASLTIVKKDYTVKKIQETEQKIGYNNDNALLLEFLKHRKYGNVYQFILTAQRTEYVNENQIETVSIEPADPAYIGNIYYSSETKNFEKKKSIRLAVSTDGTICEQIDYKNINEKWFRYDPIEGTHCLVKDLCIQADGKTLPVNSHNGKDIGGNRILFETNDPKFFVEMPENTECVAITGKLIPLFTKTERKMILKIIKIEECLKAKELETEKLQKSNEQLSQENKSLRLKQSEYQETKRKLEIIEKKFEQLQNKLNESEKSCEQMKESVSWKVTGPMRKIRQVFNDSGKEAK